MQQIINFVPFQNVFYSRNICNIKKISTVTRMLVGWSLSCIDAKSIIHLVWWIYGICNVYYKKIKRDFMQSSRFFCNLHCKCTCTSILFPKTLKICAKPSHMLKFWCQLVNWGLIYWAASVSKKFFFRGYMASNIMDSQNISKTFPYGEVLVSIGQLGPEILGSLHFQEFLL